MFSVFRTCYIADLNFSPKNAKMLLETRVARWYIFKPKNPNVGKLWRAF
jgi:hypothetical protein